GPPPRLEKYPLPLSRVLRRVYGAVLISSRVGEPREMHFQLPDKRTVIVAGQEFKVERFRKNGNRSVSDGFFKGLGAIDMVIHLSHLSGPKAEERAEKILAESSGKISGWRARDFHKAKALEIKCLNNEIRKSYAPPAEEQAAWPAARASLAADLGVAEEELEALKDEGRLYAQRMGWGVFPCQGGVFMKVPGEGGKWLGPGSKGGPWVLDGTGETVVVTANPEEALKAKQDWPEATVAAFGQGAKYEAVQSWLSGRKAKVVSADEKRLKRLVWDRKKD
ncbi:MAG: hypothetical protein LBE49_05650, partial [Deltaproteobacteria bacterium]|nr:hypothetical protein [Deltaproteobacteria bacterium]